ncbi:toxic anion resistance protein [Niallia sp. Krafla_26]|uniref:toxic anion resistance protein n=1 Tax=Niallia sp. Krafla_26 TaxID=3064703 RepID=UPI003D1742C5
MENEVQLLDIFEIEMGIGTEQQQRVVQLLKEMNIKDSTFVIGYGTHILKEISQFSDKILSHVTAKDSGEVGSIVTELMLKIKEVDGDYLVQKGGLASIPVIGALFNKAKKFISQYEKISIQIEKITGQLDKAQIQLIKDITMLDGLYERNKKYFQELNLYIEAGQIKVEEIRDVIIPSLQEKAKGTNDAKVLQELNELTQFVDRFEKKIHNLQLSRAITIQTAPQIRMIQNNNHVLADKIQSSILQTIPLWKQQLVIALTLARQQNALKLQKEVTETTNELLLKNSELVKQGSIDIARENEKGIVEIETLKTTQSNLIAILEETITIQTEGKHKREEALVALQKMENELKAKMEEMVK